MTAPPRTTRTGRYGSHVRASGDLELWVYDLIDAEFGVNAGDLVRQVRAAGPVPVTVRIDSDGGDVFSSLALYECLRTHPAPVTIYVDGHAASAASVIAMAATDLAMGPGSFLMLHAP
jgi:ATP-dependent protease ClpP protease subunit